MKKIEQKIASLGTGKHCIVKKTGIAHPKDQWRFIGFIKKWYSFIQYLKLFKSFDQNFMILIVFPIYSCHWASKVKFASLVFTMNLYDPHCFSIFLQKSFHLTEHLTHVILAKNTKISQKKKKDFSIKIQKHMLAI